MLVIMIFKIIIFNLYYNYIENHNTSGIAVFDLQLCNNLICVEWVILVTRFIMHPNYEIHILFIT